jgi:prepilin-type N-terminal cleavage/methylation domain-containing protein
MSMQRRPSQRRGRSSLRQHDRDDSGVTLVELMVAMSIFLVLITITFPVLNTFFSVDNSMAKTVASVNQILPATTTLERYLRSAVQPAPATVVTAGLPGTPVPMFAPVSGVSTFQMNPNSVTFYSNVGDANGPEQVAATTTGPVKGLYTLTITAQRADAKTCPGSGSSMSSTSPTCTYTLNPTKIIAVINSITNGSSSDANPIFQYSITANSDGTPAYPASTTTAAGWTCTSATSCNPANLISMQIYLNTQATVGSLTSIKTVVYFIAPTYSAPVG